MSLSSPNQNCITAINFCPDKSLYLREVILKITVAVRCMWEIKNPKHVTQFLPRRSASCSAAKQLLRVFLLSYTAYVCITKEAAQRLAVVPALALSLPAVRTSRRALHPAPLGASTGGHKININKQINKLTSPSSWAKCLFSTAGFNLISFRPIFAC